MITKHKEKTFYYNISEKMTNNERYKNAKIYQLIDYTTGNFYIGSTCLPLHKRLHIHKRASKNKKFKNIKLYNVFIHDMFDCGQIKIRLIEAVNVETKEQLLREENKHIIFQLDNPLCLNTYRSYVSAEQKKEELKKYMENNKEHLKECANLYRSNNAERIKAAKKETYAQNSENYAKKAQEYYLKNVEVIKEKHKNYWSENGQKINEKRKEKVTCECGTVLSKWNMTKHVKTNKHISYLNNSENTVN